MGTIAVVDLSWIMHRYRHAYEYFSCVINGEKRPTGHIYGAYHFIKDLSEKYKRVLLAVDSNPTIRKNILPTYKSNRNDNNKSDFAHYSVHNDLNDILIVCTNFKNVYFIKEEGYEADDIIGTLIRQADKDWDFYFHDDDILQNIGEYNLMVSFGKVLTVGVWTDRRQHLKEKYGLDLNYLPVLWKIIKGDGGDCISIGIERFPTKILKELCLNSRLKDNDVSFETCVEIIKSYKNYTGKTKEVVDQLKNKNSDLYKKLEINYKLVKPMIIEKIKRRKLDGDIMQVFEKYNIRDF